VGFCNISENFGSFYRRFVAHPPILQSAVVERGRYRLKDIRFAVITEEGDEMGKLRVGGRQVLSQDQRGGVAMFGKNVSFVLFVAVLLCSLAMPSELLLGKEKGHNICALRQFGQFSEWSAPVNLGPVVNSRFTDEHPAISNNGLSLYISSDRPVGFATIEGADDIWVSQRASLQAAWGPPRHLGPNINSTGGADSPNLSPDGHWLFFGSQRPGGCGSSDLWVSYRKDTDDDFAWEPAVNLGCQIITPSGGHCAPTYFEDEESGITSLYFCSSNGALGDFDIYVSMLRGDGLFGRPALVFELSTTYRDTRTAIRRDGLEMFITSNRPGTFGKVDLWVSTRETTLDAWSTPLNLGPVINTPAVEGGPALSCDGTTLYFSSDRPGGFGGRDLYVSTRQRIGGEGSNGDKGANRIQPQEDQ
jgi:hypothetical protein